MAKIYRGCSQESWLGGGTARWAWGTVHLQCAPPGPIHQMSDELVYNETKSLPVTHESWGVVPVLYVFAYLPRCFLVCARNGFNLKSPFAKMFPNYSTRNDLLICPLIGRTRLSGASAEEKVHFLTAGPSSTHPYYIQRPRRLRLEFASFQMKDFFFPKGCVLVDKTNISKKQMSPPRQCGHKLAP